MRHNSNSPRGGSQGKGKSNASSMLAAVLVGMVLGLALAGGVAWYILGRPSPFQQSAQRDAVKLEPVPSKPAALAAPAAASAVATVTAASGVDENKPRFEFYKVLTDKQDSSGATAPAAKAAAKPASVAAKDKGPFYLQAGAFANADDADKLKARLAMMGVEASIQAATLPDKSVWHRVRLGPYKTADEMNKTAAQLKQNGVSASASHAQ